MSALATGFFARGILVGTKVVEESYVDKETKQRKKVTVHLLGIQHDYTNSYGRAASMVLDLRIPNKLADDRRFMDSINQYYEAAVEIQLSGMTDYPARRQFIDNNAKITPLGSKLAG